MCSRPHKAQKVVLALITPHTGHPRLAVSSPQRGTDTRDSLRLSTCGLFLGVYTTYLLMCNAIGLACAPRKVTQSVSSKILHGNSFKTHFMIWPKIKNTGGDRQEARQCRWWSATQQLCYYATPDDAIAKFSARLRATPFYTTFSFFFFRIRNKTEKRTNKKGIHKTTQIQYFK